IQPQVPLRLPCYDFAPVTELTLDGCALAVRPPASGPSGFHGVTGGVYKARERIHRGVADPRLLAIPASCSRVADYNPNLARLLPACQAQVRFFALLRIKPHAPPLVRAPVNSFEFQPCGRTPQAGHLLR